MSSSEMASLRVPATHRFNALHRPRFRLLVALGALAALVQVADEALLAALVLHAALVQALTGRVIAHPDIAVLAPVLFLRDPVSAVSSSMFGKAYSAIAVRRVLMSEVR